MAHADAQVAKLRTNAAYLAARVATVAAFLLVASAILGLAQARTPTQAQAQPQARAQVQASVQAPAPGQGQVQTQVQDQRQNAPGQFDFYVLSLSWSPSFCDAVTERSAESAARQPECGDRRFAFVVHGLWPQYERGFPEFCQNPAPRLDRSIIASMLDMMPSPRLIFRTWDRHGVCSGLPARAYFETIRKARAMIKIPPAYLDLADAKAEPKAVTPNEVEDAFVAANPGLTHDGIAIGCDAKRLSEVRICVSKDLKFRSCAEVDQRACRLEQALMPRMRGG
jgi:ribonuclease T2